MKDIAAWYYDAAGKMSRTERARRLRAMLADKPLDVFEDTPTSRFVAAMVEEMFRPIARRVRNEEKLTL